jgi:pSer/pThr/pTyr-binding forkhead associated (FHA) protein
MITCPRCGRTNEGKFRFCLGCGAALPAESRAPVPLPTGAPQPAGAPLPPAGPNPVARPPSEPGLAPLANPAARPAPVAPLIGNAEFDPPTNQVAVTLPPRTAAPAVPRPATVPMSPTIGTGPNSGPRPPVPMPARTTAPMPPRPLHSSDDPYGQHVPAGMANSAAGTDHNDSFSTSALPPMEVPHAARPIGGTAEPIVPAPPRPISSVPLLAQRVLPPQVQAGPAYPGQPQSIPVQGQHRGATPGQGTAAPAPSVPRPMPPGLHDSSAVAGGSAQPGVPQSVQPQAVSQRGGPSPWPRPTPGPGPTASHCTTCGHLVEPANAFCGKCGAPISHHASTLPMPQAMLKTEKLGFVALIDDNGTESLQFPLHHGENRIGGGEDCQLRFPEDGFLAGVHCVLEADLSKVILRPLDQVNGTYLRISAPIELKHGDVIRVGQEVLRFERMDRLVPELNALGLAEAVGVPLPRGVWGRLSQLHLTRQVANAYLLSTPDVFLGRERGDILFPRDGFVSGSHAVLSDRGGRAFLKDLGSSNGTFVRLKQEVPLRSGDLFLLGRNLLRIHLNAAA